MISWYWYVCKSVENKLDEQTVVFIVALNQDKYSIEHKKIQEPAVSEIT